MHRVWIVDVFALIRSTRMQRTFQDGSPDRGQPSTVYVWSCLGLFDICPRNAKALRMAPD
jgi:putative alpha-1,2-mannosidase